MSLVSLYTGKISCVPCIQVKLYHLCPLYTGKIHVKEYSLTTIHRDCTEAELNLPQPGGKYKHGKYQHTVQVDTELYLPWLLEMFTQQGDKKYGDIICDNNDVVGGKVEKRKITNLTSLHPSYDIVVVCAGLGARDLCGDKTVLPMRGQVS